MTDRAKPGRRASGISLAVNGALFAVKLVTGVVVNSTALIANALKTYLNTGQLPPLPA